MVSPIICNLIVRDYVVTLQTNCVGLCALGAMLTIANSRYDWQYYMRGIARGMIDLLMGYMANGCIHTRIAAVEVAIVAREVAGRDFEAQPMAGFEYMTRCPQVDRVAIHFSWGNERRI